MIPAANRNKQQEFLLIFIIGLLNTIGPFSIDMYLPAFPEIAGELHTNIQTISLSVSTYFLGFAAGQILYGPLLDRFGRKIPLYIGLGCYIIATLACGLSGTTAVFLSMRFLQALSGSVGAVAALAMVRDFYPPSRSASIISFLILIISLSPMLAPGAGSFVAAAFGWRSIFITLASIAFIVMLLVFIFLPQAKPPDVSVSLRPKPIIINFKNILSQPQFYVYTLAGTFSFAALFVYVAGSPGIFMDGFAVSAKIYGGIFALLSVGFIGASQLNHALTRRYKSQKIFRAVIVIQIVTAALFFTGVINNWYGLAATLVFLFIILGCAGLSYPNAAAVALAPFARNAGSASALLGFIQMGIGGLLSSAVGFIKIKGSFPASLLILITSVIAAVILLATEGRVHNTVEAEVDINVLH
ncbi:multidrug effflux MFS transporter [Parafilimonas terrae]|uniref:MFS transporter, DHA1 family, bicyclomycin/chloramphenicol resistance protein n=1 Tax=Parafilimonas terrae TaxID=1465490 RepID=A0A1I5VJU9_9BACT|nr:multidrug effflux MFS transporter [Parafilimonas terrae]SFQ07743.1 MFS transporter, DHA1 family, bicyclomycin/chloramphenicol resistance protein [Parafilimonas terrae]